MRPHNQERMHQTIELYGRGLKAVVPFVYISQDKKNMIRVCELGTRKWRCVASIATVIYGYSISCPVGGSSFTSCIVDKCEEKDPLLRYTKNKTIRESLFLSHKLDEQQILLIGLVPVEAAC